MKYEIGRSENIQETEKHEPVYVYDGKGNRYSINTNGLGELVITASDGSMRIEPMYSNQIILFTED